MAKKNNVYKSLDFSVIKQELLNTMSYLETIDVEKIDDDIEFKATARGGIAPSIVSSIENKLKTCIILIFDFVSQLEVLYKTEGMTPYIADLIDSIKEKMEELQKYYLKRHPKTLSHRKAIYTSPKSGKKVTFLAATVQDQIKCRSDIQKKILQILPKLSSLLEAKKEINIKGGSDIPPSLNGLI